MMSKLPNKRLWLWLLISAALIAALVVFVLWVILDRQSVVEIQLTQADTSSSNSSDKMLCYFTEADFQLRWIHSVEKQWWEEQYVRESNALLLTTTYFEAFGAGTPSTEVLASVQKPGYIGYQINQKLPKLNWVVSRLTKGEIDYADHRILIHEWVPDYSEIVISSQAYSLADRLKKDLCHELSSDGSK